MSNTHALRRLVWSLPALGSFLAGLALAWHHPLWPTAASVVFVVWCVLAAWRPNAWLLLAPACLPWLNFSPWTGWLIFEEFDILLLGALAGGYARLACAPPPDPGTPQNRVLWFPVTLLLLLGASGLWALWRGVMDAGGFAFDWFAGYTDALNSVRVFKSLGFVLLFAPLLASIQARPPARAGAHFAWGMVLGLLQVTLAAVWERAAFPGVFDFSSPYRTVALFWEMHVGGAAIDAYLALSTPFVVWALVRARTPAAWVGSGILAMGVGYACLTTFSRGVYGAVTASLLLLGVLLWLQTRRALTLACGMTVPHRRRFDRWRHTASLLLLLVLLAEVVGVLGAGSFMTRRLGNADRDLDSRRTHWQHGLDLLQQPADWLLGIGLGRFPAHYASQAPRGEFPGSVKPGDGFVTLTGPASRRALGGLYALTQRVASPTASPLWVSLQVRVQAPTHVSVRLCERHLLYDGHCQAALVRVLPKAHAWQTLLLPLRGPALSGGKWYAPRLHLFSLAVTNAGGMADIGQLWLLGSKGTPALANGDFSQGLAQWFPAAQSHFVPWHSDNLFLELLVERGLLGLLLWLTWAGYAAWHVLWGSARAQAHSPFLAASLFAVLLVGLVSSVMDVPRVATLVQLLVLASTPTMTKRI